jgi:hypothetical protein
MEYFNWHTILGVLSGLIVLFSISTYAKDILHGTSRPNTVSNVIWSLIVAISISAQINSGASWSILLVIGDLISVLFVTGLCFAGYGYKKFTWVEYVCAALGIAAIILWQATSNPLWAVCFAASADFIAGVPTLVKTYRDPWSELPFAWALVAFASVLGIISTVIWDLANLLLPMSILLINGSVAALAFFGRRLKSKHV